MGWACADAAWLCRRIRGTKYSWLTLDAYDLEFSIPYGRWVAFAAVLTASLRSPNRSGMRRSAAPSGLPRSGLRHLLGLGYGGVFSFPSVRIVTVRRLGPGLPSQVFG